MEKDVNIFLMVQFMKDIGSITSDMVKVDSFSIMATYTKENGKITSHLVRGSSSITKMDINLQVIYYFYINLNVNYNFL